MTAVSPVECKLELAFKGARTYITGADFVAQIPKALSNILDGPVWLQTIKFRGFASHACFIRIGDGFPKAPQTVRGEFTVVYKDTVYSGIILESSDEVSKRIPYDESLIIGDFDIQNRAVKSTKATIHSRIDELVSLTKQLHNSIYPLDKGQWVFLQLNLQEALPDVYDVLRVEIDKVLKQTFTLSSIFVDGAKIGTIRFSAVER